MPRIRDLLKQLRRICLALPEATEKTAWGEPTFRVRGKMFAMCNGESHPGPLEVWIKALPGAQEALVASDPKRYFVPPYVGHKGWIGVRLHADVDWSVITDLVHEAFRMTAPKRLSAPFDLS